MFHLTQTPICSCSCHLHNPKIKQLIATKQELVLRQEIVKQRIKLLKAKMQEQRLASECFEARSDKKTMKTNAETQKLKYKVSPFTSFLYIQEDSSGTALLQTISKHLEPPQQPSLSLTDFRHLNNDFHKINQLSHSFQHLSAVAPSFAHSEGNCQGVDKGLKRRSRVIVKKENVLPRGGQTFWLRRRGTQETPANSACKSKQSRIYYSP